MSDRQSQVPLQEGVDYTFDEKGLIVFTEAYHLKRGTCCKSGCRHCPYGFTEKHTKESAATTAGLDSPVLGEGTQIIRREGWYQLFSPRSTDESENEVMLSHLQASEVERIVRDTLSQYQHHDLSLKWATGPMSSPARLESELAKKADSTWAFRGMAIDTSASFPVSENVRVERVSSKNFEEFLNVNTIGWEMQPLSQRARDKLERMVSDPRCRSFLVRSGGQAIGSAGTFLKDGYGYLVGAVVLKDFRGCGAYRALVQARLTDLRDLGLPFAVSQAREATSAPILERLGFETIYNGRMFRFDPKA